jgi:hypothetical protein
MHGLPDIVKRRLAAFGSEQDAKKKLGLGFSINQRSQSKPH